MLKTWNEMPEREVESGRLWRQPNVSEFPGSLGMGCGRVAEMIFKAQLDVHMLYPPLPLPHPHIILENIT